MNHTISIKINGETWPVQPVVAAEITYLREASADYAKRLSNAQEEITRLRAELEKLGFRHESEMETIP